MVNSSWTENHIHNIWNIASRTFLIYPPCEVSHLKRLEHIDTDEIIILSVAQFRPEKDHALQVKAMHELRTLLADNETLWNKVYFGHCVIFTTGKTIFSIFFFIFFLFELIFIFICFLQIKLVIVGSCRNDEDFARKKTIEELIKQLSLESSVEIRHNLPYPELIRTYQTASIGLHTMWNEHFGIGIVELMAAGLIMVANK